MRFTKPDSGSRSKRDDRGLGCLQGLQAVDMVGVVVRDDDVAHRRGGDAADLGQQLLRQCGRAEGADDRHAVARDHERGIRDEVAIRRRAEPGSRHTERRAEQGSKHQHVLILRPRPWREQQHGACTRVNRYSV
jgi:hypothetical protein